MTPDRFREQWPAIAEIPAVADLLAECDRLEQFIQGVRSGYVVVRQIDEGDRCPECGGSGVTDYPNTGAWYSGVGGAVITEAHCDVCWGSGRKGRPWANLREWRDKMQALRAENERLRRNYEEIDNARRCCYDEHRALVHAVQSAMEEAPPHEWYARFRKALAEHGGGGEGWASTIDTLRAENEQLRQAITWLARTGGWQQWFYVDIPPDIAALFETLGLGLPLNYVKHGKRERAEES